LAVIGFTIIGIAGIVFIKLDTSAAAEITDKYLRPIFGDRQVIFMEKIFFDISDKSSGIIYHLNIEKPSAPQFINSGTQKNSYLDLNSITPNQTFASLDGEGVWHNIPLNIFPDKEVMAYTFVRPDSDRSFAMVSVVKIDIKSLSMGSVAGTVEPGGKVGKYGPGRVPKDIAQSGGLVAAFDGGF